MWRYKCIVIPVLFFLLILMDLSFTQDEYNRRKHLISQFANMPVHVTAYPNMNFATGVMFTSDTVNLSRGYTIVTNKHVLLGADSVDILMQLEDAELNSIDSITKSYRLYSDSGDSLFVVHDSLDIAAIFVDSIRTNSDRNESIYTTRDTDIINPDELYQGQRILFFGYPKNIRIDGKRPLVRRGIIAGYDKTSKYAGIKHVIFIDGQVYGGSSGSPVFIDPVNELNSHGFFIGIIAGHIPIENYRLIDGKTGKAFLFEENTGIGVVMPADDISVLSNIAKIRYIRAKSK